MKGCHKLVEEMIIIHNIILRGINSIYLQCVDVETMAPESVPDFVDYTRMWALMGEIFCIPLEREHPGPGRCACAAVRAC